ncbi:SDR family NAD(P)-dependent oxidoreductase [Hydrogenophaga sp.]|uniref:SDR family NAD(P)-dependent oxidoreductase n=1 Tax=Hydrogenophaga sp. TaxID=1904254 RepID=UPI00271A8A38|nr:SDR family oxidoreductase [Hydrogenophaga sp.]MDO9433834.1 SDR family oxidoreductase [Hydrogenophaga sp.]
MAPLSYGLQGKTVLLTGAAGGIGSALARAFAAQGARLMLLDRADTTLPMLSAELDATAAVCDLGDASQIARIATQVRERWGQLDLLINNAGTEYPTPLADETPDAMARWSGLLDNNVGSMVRLTHALLPLLPRGASIINQSSIWGRIGVAGFSAYAASKHAVVGLTRSLALELGPRGIRVNAVCPGWVRTAAALRSLTAMAQEQGRSEADVEREILSKQAMPVMLTPEDLAGVFLFLASDGAAPLTGQCLVASHGEVMA